MESYWNCNQTEDFPNNFFDSNSQCDASQNNECEVQLSKIFSLKEESDDSNREIEHKINNADKSSSSTSSSANQQLFQMKTQRQSSDHKRKELLLQRNRESAKRSRDKRRNEFHDLFNENQSLTNQLKELQSQINNLCPQCRKLFNPQPTQTRFTTSTPNIVQSIPSPTPSSSSSTKQLLFFTGAVALLCIFSTIMSIQLNLQTQSKYTHRRLMTQRHPSPLAAVQRGFYHFNTKSYTNTSFLQEHLYPSEITMLSSKETLSSPINMK